jgi:hypothetical protein
VKGDDIDPSFFDRRLTLAKHHVSLEKFVADHDAEVYGRPLLRAQLDGRSPIQELEKLVHLRIDNPFQSVPDLHAHLDSLDLLNVDRLRPQWDTYFMVRTVAGVSSFPPPTPSFPHPRSRAVPLNPAQSQSHLVSRGAANDRVWPSPHD